jgi:hypothetical protein
MASKLLVDELAPYAHATDVTITTGKNITGANTQFKITGGATDNVLTTDGSGALSWGASPVGVAEFDQWFLPTSFTGSVFPITTMARLNFGPFGAPAGTVGTGMGHSAGTFSFPSTGKWLINFHMLCTATTTADVYCRALLKVSINTGGSYTLVAQDSADTPAVGALPSGTCNMTSTYLMDVTNITTHLVQVGSSLQTASNTVIGDSSLTYTNVTFMKVS